MNTEIKETCNAWIFYDADCAFCRGWVDRAYPVLLHRHCHFVPLQASWARARLGLKDAEPLTELKLLTPEGLVLGGADAFIRLARSVWWAWPFYALAQLPGLKPVVRAVYRWLAVRRHRFSKACQMPNSASKHCHHGASAFYELP